LVFAAAPYGAIGALIALAIMGTPFGFMAFLGVVPVFYSIFVLDLKWIKWETKGDGEQAAEAEPTT